MKQEEEKQIRDMRAKREEVKK